MSASATAVPLPEKEEVHRERAAADARRRTPRSRRGTERRTSVASVTRGRGDAAHALDVIREGASRRASAATALNERRAGATRGDGVRRGARRSGAARPPALVDLAGSERVSRSEASGDRLKEAAQTRV